MPEIFGYGSASKGKGTERQGNVLQMPREGTHRGEMPKGSTTVWRVWAGPHYGAALSSGSSDDKTSGAEQTANDNEHYDRKRRERSEQSMTIYLRVSVFVGKR